MDLPTHSHYPPPSEDVLRRFWTKIRIVRDAVTGASSEGVGSEWAARAVVWNASSSASDCAVCSAARRLCIVARGQLACQVCLDRIQGQAWCTRMLRFLFDATKDDYFSDFDQFSTVYRSCLERDYTERVAQHELYKNRSEKRHREGASNDVCQPIAHQPASNTQQAFSFPMPTVNDAAQQAPRKRARVTSKVIEIMDSDEEELPASITLASARAASKNGPAVIDLRSPSPEPSPASDPLDQLLAAAHYLESQNAPTSATATPSAEARPSSTPARATPLVGGSSAYASITFADLLAPSPEPTTLPISGTRYGSPMPGPSSRRDTAPAPPAPALTPSGSIAPTRMGAAPMSCLLPPGMDAPRRDHASTRRTTGTSSSSIPSETLPTRPPSAPSSDVEIIDAPPASATVDVRCGDTNFKKYQQIVLNHSGRAFSYMQDSINHEEEAFKHSLGQLAVQMANHWCPKNPFADKQSKLMGRCKYVAKIPRVCLEKERERVERAAREAGGEG
ncbi:hypothetical protein MKEN_00158000 [Mycena kentingensis (nom. inval.)]|nr:hypothetical protein MKEN_00158000 [Mycena kentingensis (nom. inval.)]